MIVFPNCKINLGLNITRKRSDGYHDLETVFYPVPFTDVLEIAENRNPDSGKSIGESFTTSGIPVKGNLLSNICLKAYRMLKEDFRSMPHIVMHLHKAIPSGAGLGGGSGDGTFALQVLNKLFNLKISQEKMLEYAARLGSDCPFFVYNKACLATGRGEMLEPVELDLSDYRIMVVFPGVSIYTGGAFGKLTPAEPAKPIREIIKEPVEEWKDQLTNDFEKIVFPDHPEIAAIKDELYKQGAVYASMTGSGSSVYGLFDKTATPDIPFPKEYLVKLLQLN